MDVGEPYHNCHMYIVYMDFLPCKCVLMKKRNKSVSLQAYKGGNFPLESQIVMLNIQSGVSKEKKVRIELQ